MSTKRTEGNSRGIKITYEQQVVWHKVTQRVHGPEASGEYLVITGGGYYMTMSYSFKYKAFNTIDTLPKEMQRPVKVLAWCDINIKEVKDALNIKSTC